MPNVSTAIEVGCARPIAYDTCTSHRSASPAATRFLATYRAAYAAERSTLLGSLPLKAPPPCRAIPPYVSTMILRPVSPASAAGPPTMNFPLGLTMILVLASMTMPSSTGSMTSERTPSLIAF